MASRQSDTLANRGAGTEIDRKRGHGLKGRENEGGKKLGRAPRTTEKLALPVCDGGSAGGSRAPYVRKLPTQDQL